MSGSLIVVTSIDAIQRKWTWDLALSPATTTPTYPISLVTVFTRGEGRSPDNANTNKAGVPFKLRDGALALVAPTSWLGVVSNASSAVLPTDTSNNGTSATGSGGLVVTVSEAIVKFLDAVCATGKMPTTQSEVPEGLQLSPSYTVLTSFANAGATIGAGAAPAAPRVTHPGPQLVTVKDKLENKFAITVSKQSLEKFKQALEQRLISMRYRLPASISGDSEEGLAILYYHYVSEEFWKHSDRLGSVKKTDYEDWHAKEVAFFRAKKPICNGDLCISACTGSAFRWLVVLSNTDLDAILQATDAVNLVNLSERKLTIGKPDVIGSWLISVNGKKATTDGADAREIILEATIKTRSSAEETVFNLPVVVSALPEEEGDVIQPAKPKGPLVFTKGTEFVTLPTTIASYDLPAPTEEGPRLVDVPKIDPIQKPETIVGGATSNIALEGKEVKATQSISSGATFTNFFTAALQLTNKAPATTECLSATAVKMEYKNAADEWVEMVDPYLVVKGYGSNMEIVKENVDLTEVGAAVVGVRGGIPITGKCGADNFERARAHRSLPQPLNVRVTMTEVISGAVHLVEMQQANAPIVYDTAKTMADSWGATNGFAVFVTADDFDAGSRVCAGVYSAKDGMTLRRAGYYTSYNADDILGVAYTAKKKGNEVHELDGGNADVKFFALVDINATPLPVWYGVRVDVKTPTGKSTGFTHVAL